MTPLVLIHAFPLDAGMYGSLREQLPSDWQVIAPNLPGFGGTPVADAEPSLDVYADHVAAELDRLGVDQAMVGGTSMGGYVVMALCRRHPERVAGLALIDTKAVADLEAAADGRRAMADRLASEQSAAALVEAVMPKLLGATSFATRTDLVSSVQSQVAACAPDAAAWAQRAMAARPDSLQTLAGMSVPAVVVVGEEDVLTVPAESVKMAESMVDARLVAIPAVGHLTPVEAPDDVAVALRHLQAAVDG